jgi:hypothetical protein
MAKPTESYTWATDATYDADAAANKVEPGSTQRANGFERGEEPGAQHVNYHLNALGEWLGYLDVANPADPIVIMGSKLVPVDPSEWVISDLVATAVANDAQGYIRLDSELLKTGMVISKIEVLVQPGAARSTTNRIILFASRLLLDWGNPTVSSGTNLSPVGTPEDDGSTDIQAIDFVLTALPITYSEDQPLAILVQAGNDAGTNNDVIWALRITWAVSAP